MLGSIRQLLTVLSCLAAAAQVVHAVPLYPSSNDIVTNTTRIDQNIQLSDNDRHLTKRAVPSFELKIKLGGTFIALIEEPKDSGWTEETLRDVAQAAYGKLPGTDPVNIIAVAWDEGEAMALGTVLRGDKDVEVTFREKLLPTTPALESQVQKQQLNTDRTGSIFHAEVIAAYVYEAAWIGNAKGTKLPPGSKYPGNIKIVAFGRLNGSTITIFFSVIACRVTAIPLKTSDVFTSEPFERCLQSGGDWQQCRQNIFGANVKRELSWTPFHDCLEEGNSWMACRGSLEGLSGHSTSLELRGVAAQHQEKRAVFDFTENNKKYGGNATCYSSDKVGADGWITNTDAKNLAISACKEALLQASQTKTWGTFKKKVSGFYDGLGGPVVQAGVKFALSTRLKEEANIDINHLGQDLCLKGVEHLMSDKGCTGTKKVGLITAHTSVNGGFVEWTDDGNPPQRPVEDEDCTNCIMELFLEAANKINVAGAILDTPEK